MAKSKEISNDGDKSQATLNVPCCPTLDKDQPCDLLDFHYRQIHPTFVSDRQKRVFVEVLLHFRLERCSGPLALGDLAYSTTLFPGEKVRLFTMDRRTRFSFDSSSSLSYRHEQTSEEHYYMSSMDDFMSDITVRDEIESKNKNKGSFETKGKTSGAIQSFFGGASLTVTGSYDAESTRTFMRELSQHAEASHNRSVTATKTANAVSIGEVQTRRHAEGETEDHFEASSREFTNPNRCHAVTFFFYQINKTQTIKFTLESIQRRVINPAVDTAVGNNPFTSRGEVEVIPSAILATDTDRLQKEEVGRTSAFTQINQAVRLAPSGEKRAGFQTATANIFALPPTIEFTRAERIEALKNVDEDLASEGLIDRKTGEASQTTKKQFSFEVKTSLPTPGLLVRSCLDDCNVCEPALQEEIEIDLARKRLENELLEKKIELLEKSQEYRCCPEESSSEEEASES